MLWTAIHLPNLPLQVFLRAASLSEAVIVGDGREVLACNHHAKCLGIKSGIAISAALALAPHGCIYPRDQTAETQMLTAIAVWAGQFTPTLSLIPPCGILLEIGGCLNIFSGLKQLIRRIRSGLSELGYEKIIATAPTPSGALLLSQAGYALHITKMQDLKNQLMPLPISLLDCPQHILDALSDIGVHSFADFLRLPRAGLARRFGQTLLDQVDQAFGNLADPRVPFIPPSLFSNTLWLPVAVHEVEPLLFAVKRLILELVGFLKAKMLGVIRMRLDLKHEDATTTQVVLKLATPSREPEHLLSLLRERLSQTSLPQGVEHILLTAEETAPLIPQRLGLFSDKASDASDDTTLIERLRARLGDSAVYGIQTFPDHRPEHARCRCEPGKAVSAPLNKPRPLWLLPEPQLLGETTPWRNGPLTIVFGPERIESGWWDGFSVMRDYFIARNPKGETFWIFKERKTAGKWFLHGIFS